ncbi:MAG: SUMF1/EgtB/PvdO family nonheme iron enzyme [Acidobacteria bacterium]|nr:SUMF1/EgtB/PvdO family nonheme iron enzyme [Acidobacteriota bacterium]
MAAPDWTRIEEIFEKAVQIEDKTERRNFVDQNAGDDRVLRSALYSLLQNDSRENGVLDHPAFSLGTKVLAGEAANEFFAGLEFAHYRLIRLIGRGGMGVVYLAEDVLLGRLVALKILPTSLLDHSASARFRQEARLASKISHPSVAQVYEFGENNGRHFIAIEYVDGRTLRELISSGTLTVARIIEIAVAIASALKAAHELGIAHRDIKPENIAVTKNGFLKVLDFGLAKVLPTAESEQADTMLETIPGLLMGTSSYMSPEQVRGNSTDHRTDIWSFGIVLFEMLTGTRPFVGETSSDVRASILRDEPIKISPVSGKFDAIVSRCLRKEPEERYQSVDEITSDLNKLKIDPNDTTPATEVTGSSRLDMSTMAPISGSSTHASIQAAGGVKTFLRRIFGRRSLLMAGFLLIAGIVGFPILYFSSYNPFQRTDSQLAANNQGEVQPTPTPPGTVRTNSLGMEFVYIPPGEFIMGSDDGPANEKPAHKVTIAEGFWMSKYEVTEAQYLALISTYPKLDTGCADCPVENLTWYMGKGMVFYLNERNDGFLYSFPTEAEWEYAARAGSSEQFYGKLNDIMWFLDNSGYRKHPVGQKMPNAWGLYDMHGNAWEWCEDIYLKDYTQTSADGSPNITRGNPRNHPLRGGSWSIDPYYCRATSRLEGGPDIKFTVYDQGIRLVARDRPIQ